MTVHSALAICQQKLLRRQQVGDCGLRDRGVCACANGLRIHASVISARRRLSLMIHQAGERQLRLISCAPLVNAKDHLSVVVDIGGGSTSWLDRHSRLPKADRGAFIVRLHGGSSGENDVPPRVVDGSVLHLACRPARTISLMSEDGRRGVCLMSWFFEGT